jgi:hypothetical protein
VLKRIYRGRGTHAHNNREPRLLLGGSLLLLLGGRLLMNGRGEQSARRRLDFNPALNLACRSPNRFSLLDSDETSYYQLHTGGLIRHLA